MDATDESGIIGHWIWLGVVGGQFFLDEGVDFLGIGEHLLGDRFGRGSRGEPGDHRERADGRDFLDGIHDLGLSISVNRPGS